jgi:spore maturation protein SpmB
MSDVNMTDGSEVLDESKRLSVLAILSLCLALVGLLSVLFLPMIPVALVASALGAVAFLLGKRNDYNLFSIIAALLAVVIGITSVTTGLLARSFSTKADLAEARKISEAYLDLIHAKDFDRIALMNGMQSPPEEFERRQPTDQEKFAFRKKNLSANPLYKEIAALPQAPKWAFVKLESEQPTSYFCDYKLIYRDENRAKSPLYRIIVRRNQPKGGPYVHPEKRDRELTEEDFKVRWTVEFLEVMR